MGQDKAKESQTNYNPLSKGKLIVTQSNWSKKNHYQEQGCRNMGAESQGRWKKTKNNKSKQARERAVWENHRNGELCYVPGDEFHGQTRVKKDNVCWINE